ncbi:MAG: hypothetical protein ACTHJ4_01200 [Candidatus Nucleicultricaceae bacterium]
MRVALKEINTVKLFLNTLIVFIFLATPSMATDLSNWMREQSQRIPGFADLTLTQIAMPGTHDSLTFNLSSEKRASGALGAAVHIPLVGKGIVKVAKAQGDDLIGQFNTGARYFDLRIELTSKGFEGVHGLYNGPITQSFQDFKDYLVNHPGEIIILDLQEINVPNTESKQELINLLRSIFGDLVLLSSGGSVNVKYSTLIRTGKRVIIVMKQADRGDTTRTAFDRRTYLKSVWHNEQDPKKLAQKIIEFEQKTPRSFNSINVIQAQTTPDTGGTIKSVIKSVFTFGIKGGLKQDAKKGLQHQNALLDKAAANPALLEAINVFMVDHLTKEQAQKIIALNTLKTSTGSEKLKAVIGTPPRARG